MSIITALFTILGIPVLANGISQLCNQAMNIGTLLTIALGVVFLVMGLCFKIVKKLFLYPLFKIFYALVCLGLVLCLLCSAFLYIFGKADTATYKEEYLIVLGCSINGSEPSQSLVRRLDKALEYLDKNHDCRIIVTGGQGEDEDMPEAEAMARYLIKNGIDESRIIKETKSTSTTESFMYANKAVDGDLAISSAVFITNDFHIYRANSLAKLQGLRLNHLSAKTPLPSLIPAYLRENLALVQMLLLKK